MRPLAELSNYTMSIRIICQMYIKRRIALITFLLIRSIGYARVTALPCWQINEWACPIFVHQLEKHLFSLCSHTRHMQRERQAQFIFQGFRFTTITGGGIAVRVKVDGKSTRIRKLQGHRPLTFFSGRRVTPYFPAQMKHPCSELKSLYSPLFQNVARPKSSKSRARKLGGVLQNRSMIERVRRIDLDSLTFCNKKFTKGKNYFLGI